MTLKAQTVNTVVSKNPITSQKGKKPGFSPVIIIGSLFFVFGFITWLNSVLIPYLRIA